ncbi:hypothetical protein CLI74_05235, partial [Porphyromonas gingivalis]
MSFAFIFQETVNRFLYLLQSYEIFHCKKEPPHEMAGQSHLDLSEILERIFKRLKINDVFLCSCSLHFVYLYLISS